MLLNVLNAKYNTEYQVYLEFNNGENVFVDLKDTIFNDHRKVFEPLRNLEYFKKFKIKLNTIAWENQADFAPEFLLELGKQQQEKFMSHA